MDLDAFDRKFREFQADWDRFKPMLELMYPEFERHRKEWEAEVQARRAREDADRRNAEAAAREPLPPPPDAPPPDAPPPDVEGDDECEQEEQPATTDQPQAPLPGED